MATATKTATKAKSTAPVATPAAKAKAKAPAAKPAPAAKKAAAPAKSKAAAKPKAAPTKAAPAKEAAAAIAPDRRRHYVEVAAYFIAERRGFMGGCEIEDWVLAEQEIDRLLGEGKLSV